MQIFNDNDFIASQSQFGESYEENVNYFLNSIDKNNLEIDKKTLAEALKICCKIGENQKQNSNEFLHEYYCDVVLFIIEELRISDINLIVAALFYCVKIDKNLIKENFDSSIFNLVAAVENVDKKNNSSKNKAEIYCNLFLAAVKDLRIFVIKLCEKLHKLRNLQNFSSEKQTETAEEIVNFYAPFARQLGFLKLQAELETRSFYFLNNPLNEQILAFLAEKKKIFSEYMFLFIEEIRESLAACGLKYQLKTVHKQEYEIFLMLQAGKKIEEIENSFSLVIILDTNDEKKCYEIYESLAGKFNSQEMLDYKIKNQTDEYKSDEEQPLVTELQNSKGKIEILIRTTQMENFAEKDYLGDMIAQKKPYKMLNFSEREIILWENWTKNIIETKGEQAAQIIWNSIKINVFDKKINVYTRKNEAIQLPENSTLIDFAFSISNETGLRAVTGKINNAVKNIFNKLNDGDIVEIITSTNSNPDSSWLNHVVSFKATCYLHHYFKINYKLKSGIKAKLPAKDYSSIHISGINKTGLLAEIKGIIGIENIKRIRLLPETDIFEAAIDTIKLDKSTTNNYFAKLFKLQNVKAVYVESLDKI